MFTATYTHKICVAHRIEGNQNGCGRIHGHNYVIKIELACNDENLSSGGMVLDFSNIKRLLGAWLDEYWDHRLLLSEDDSLVLQDDIREALEADNSLVIVPFIPTAENMAESLFMEFSALLGFKYKSIKLQKIKVQETDTGEAEYYED